MVLRKPIIVLQTDFSLSWAAVSEMKGVIKIVDRDLEVEDLCHEIKNFDPWEASLSLNTTEPYWPKGTIFVSVVDPGVGTSRKASVAKLKDGNYVVTPDNGSLTHLVHTVGVDAIREIDETTNRYHAREKVSVFHGRDLFGYCAAKLASGLISFEEVGPEYPVEEIVECEEYNLEPTIKENTIEGFLLTGNRHFGGILFNVDNATWLKQNYAYGTRFHITITNNEHTYFDEDVPYEKSFGFVEKGKPVLYCGSSLYLAMDLNMGNLMDTYHLDTGKNWYVRIEEVK